MAAQNVNVPDAAELPKNGEDVKFHVMYVSIHIKRLKTGLYFSYYWN